MTSLTRADVKSHPSITSNTATVSLLKHEHSNFGPDVTKVTPVCST